MCIRDRSKGLRNTTEAIVADYRKVARERMFWNDVFSVRHATGECTHYSNRNNQFFHDLPFKVECRNQTLVIFDSYLAGLMPASFGLLVLSFLLFTVAD